MLLSGGCVWVGFPFIILFMIDRSIQPLVSWILISKWYLAVILEKNEREKKTFIILLDPEKNKIV